MTFTLLPVTGKDFVGREKILKEMLKTLKERETNIGYVIYGIRRVGKTSIFKEIQRRFEKEKDIVVIYFSVWDLMNNKLSNFIKEFTATVLESYRSYLSLEYKSKNLLKASLSLLKDIVRNLRVSIKIKDSIEVLLSFDEERANYDKLVEECFNLPEKIAKETNTKCILLIDEFPSLMDLKQGHKMGENFIRKIRTIHENHKKTTICISGSIRKTMEVVAFSSVSPFYKQFIPREIKSLELNDVRTLIKINMKNKKLTEEALEKIYELTQGIPFYIQFIGKKLLASEAKEIDKKEVNKIVDSFLKEEGNTFFIEMFKNLSDKEQNLIATMAIDDLNSISQISKVTEEPTNIISRYMYYLIDKGILKKETKGEYIFVDNMFKNWLISRFG
ncbi:MAG: ATP-binding protein [Candidatus Aenigmarchaeota archaeon]|nr:ATP-binding protein [Candidatus Aenigmarchaeota archaeon]